MRARFHRGPGRLSRGYFFARAAKTSNPDWDQRRPWLIIEAVEGNASDRANSRVGAVNSRLRDAVCEGWGISCPFRRREVGRH